MYRRQVLQDGGNVQEAVLKDGGNVQEAVLQGGGNVQEAVLQDGLYMGTVQLNAWSICLFVCSFVVVFVFSHYAFVSIELYYPAGVCFTDIKDIIVALLEAGDWWVN